MNRLTLAALALTAALASPAIAQQATTSVRITSAAGSYLQIAELQLFANGQNVALGKLGTASSVYLSGDAGGQPYYATDGVTSADFPYIYHSDNGDGSDYFDLNLGGTYDLSKITIFGRTGNDCCHYRDYYNYALYDGAKLVGSGTLDARSAKTGYSASANITAVPEPTTWALMALGFGMMGYGLRRRAKQSVRVTYA